MSAISGGVIGWPAVAMLAGGYGTGNRGAGGASTGVMYPREGRMDVAIAGSAGVSGDCDAGAVRLWLSVGLKNAADCGAAAGADGGADAAREPAAESAAAADAIMTARRAAVCTSSTLDFAGAPLEPGNCTATSTGWTCCLQCNTTCLPGVHPSKSPPNTQGLVADERSTGVNWGDMFLNTIIPQSSGLRRACPRHCMPPRQRLEQIVQIPPISTVVGPGLLAPCPADIRGG